jgi:GH25 family lysozyme M1 (1,4-beta-N-acetylmuramidase)
MALGIDIYGRYQTVTNWQAVKDFGVTFAYVKATDGSGYANVRADGMVNGAHGVDIPVGLYHFSQPGNAVAQANLLLGEVRRLNAAGRGPALDLEDNPPGSGKANIPDSQKAAYAIPFLRTVAAAGFRPVVYMNSALAKLLRPDRWDIPGLALWIASYGANDGRRHALTGGYPGRIDIHQYTSLGHIPGISGSVDLNESLTDITNTTEDDVLTPDDGNTEWAYFNIYTGDLEEKKVADWIGENNSIARRVSEQVTAFDGELTEVKAKLDSLAVASGDPQAIISAAVAEIKKELAPLFDLANRLES